MSISLSKAAFAASLCLLSGLVPATTSAAALIQTPFNFYDTQTDGLVHAMAISGNTMAIVSINGTLASTYIYLRVDGAWIETARLQSGDREVPSNNAFVNPGSGVAISPDGKTVFMADSTAACSGDASLSCGEVAVFRKPSTGWANTKTADARLRPSVTAAEYMGMTLALSSDGSTLAVAARAHACPTPPNNPLCEGIYVFQKPVGSWSDATQTAVLTTVSGNTETPSVGVDGGVIAANAGGDGVLVFLEPIAGWADASTQDAILTNAASGFDDILGDFGIQLQVSGDLILVGAPNVNAALIYQKPVSGWATTTAATAILSPPASVSFFFVNGVTAKGSSVYVGSQTEVYEYDMPLSGTWVSATPSASIFLNDATAAGILSDGSELAIPNDTFFCSDGSPCPAGVVLSSSINGSNNVSGMAIAGITVDDVTDSQMRSAKVPGGGIINVNFDIENLGPGMDGKATFKATLPGKITSADSSCSISGSSVTCPVTLSPGNGLTLTVTLQLALSAATANVQASLSEVSPQSWDVVNGAFEQALSVFFEPIVPTDATRFLAAPGAVITGKMPVIYGGKSPLQFTVFNQPAEGSLVINASTGSFTWKPPAGFDFLVSFNYYVSDGVHSTNLSTVVLDETPAAPSGKGGGGDCGGIELMLLAGALLARRRRVSH